VQAGLLGSRRRLWKLPFWRQRGARKRRQQRRWRRPRWRGARSGARERRRVAVDDGQSKRRRPLQQSAPKVTQVRHEVRPCPGEAASFAQPYSSIHSEYQTYCRGTVTSFCARQLDRARLMTANSTVVGA
jgi:hypothetical protein